MRQPLISIVVACTIVLSSAPLFASGSGESVYDLQDIGPGSGAGVVFVDALQQASGWTSTSPARLALDPAGNVRSLQAGQSADRVVYSTEAYRAGDYTLLYDGSGSFDVRGGTIVANAPSRATIRVNPNSGSGLTLRLVATDPANPVRDVRLVLPGYEATYATQPFLPDYVRSLLGRKVLRFAQWMHADTYVDSVFWTQRPHVGRATQVTPSGVAPEYMILLANLTGATPWFTLPAGATDAYVYNFARLVHGSLDPRLRPIFQYGNEVWNPATAGNGYARMAARNVGIPGEPSTAALSWYAHRSARIFSLVRAAFGSDAARVVTALSGPAPEGQRNAALDTFLLQSSGRDLNVFAVPAAGPSALANATRLVLPWRLEVFAYASEPPPSAARQTPLSGPIASAHLVLGTDRPAEYEPRRARSKTDPGFSAVPPLKAKPAFGLGDRPGVAGALGVPLPHVDVEAEGTLDWLKLRGNTIAGRKALAHPLLGAAASGDAFAFSAPADGRQRVMRIYASVDHAQGKLVATLGNSTYSDVSLSELAGARAGVYTLVYRAAGPGQRLSVRFSAQGPPGGSVAVQAAALVALPQTGTPSDEPLYHNDLLRTGWNTNETALTPANVKTTAFKALQTLTVDGNVLAQPLYLAQYTVAGTAHNLLIVATENDSLYEFDADSGALLKQVSFGTSQSSNDVGCGDISPTYGVTATPVIDRASGTIYVVSATEPTAYDFHTTIHALDIATLTDKVTPVDIAASVMLNNGSQLQFSPFFQYSRPGLTWVNNSLYVGIGSHCDNDKSQIGGWLLRYNASLSQTAAFSTIGDPTGDCAGASLAAIWMAGFAPAVDAAGNLYVVTGNGAFDANTGGHDYGESALKVKSDLSQVLSYFTPSNYDGLNCGDGDFGSGGAMLLQPGPEIGPPLLVAMGKNSTIYLLNASRLGGESSSDAGALQVINDSGNGLWGGPAFYSGPSGQFVYYQTGGDVLHAYRVNYSVGAAPLTRTAPVAAATAAPRGPKAKLVLSSSGTSYAGYGGSTPVVSSNGQMPNTGIVWLVQRGSGNLYLEAYDALDVSTLLFHGNAGTWSNSANNGFVTPLVANGKVYVPSTNAVTVFGLM